MIPQKPASGHDTIFPGDGTFFRPVRFPQQSVSGNFSKKSGSFMAEYVQLQRPGT